MIEYKATGLIERESSVVGIRGLGGRLAQDWAVDCTSDWKGQMHVCLVVSLQDDFIATIYYAFQRSQGKGLWSVLITKKAWAVCQFF